MASVHGAMLAARAFNNAGMFEQITHPLLHKLIKTPDGAHQCVPAGGCGLLTQRGFHPVHQR